MKGFTLLEVMVALAILAGVILTVITSYNYHLGVVVRDKQETEALLLARARLDEPGFLKLAETSGNFAPQRPDITWKAGKTPAALPGVDRLTFTVSWDGERHKLVLVKLLEHVP
jgi:general secretion pathway protein I